MRTIPPDLTAEATHVYDENTARFDDVVANCREVLAQDFPDADPGVKVAVINAALAGMVPKATAAYFLAMALVRLAEQPTEPTPRAPNPDHE